MPDRSNLQFEEIISLLKSVLAKETKVEAPIVNVDSPNITVEPTPVVIDKTENTNVIDLSELKQAILTLSKAQEKAQLSKPLTDPEKKRVDKQQTLLLEKIGNLLKGILDKETKIEVSTPVVTVDSGGTTFDPPLYTDGKGVSIPI